MNRWLVTGAQGFVGRYTAAHVLRSDPSARVLGIGRSVSRPGSFSHTVSSPGGGHMQAPLPAWLEEDFDQRFVYRSIDVASEHEVCSVIDDFRPDFILHLASGLRDDPRAHLFRTNVEGTAALLEAVAKSPACRPKIVIGSSGGVYGNVASDRLPLKEGEACEPLDCYCVSKLSSELLARIIAGQHKLNLVIARIFNIIGAGQDERHLAGYLAAQLNCSAADYQTSSIDLKPAVRLRLGSLESTRDFIDVRDVAAALVLLTEKQTEHVIYNVGSGIERPSSDIVQAVIQTSGLPVSVERRTDYNPGLARHYADISRLRQLGFEPAHSLSSSVHSVWSYYRQLSATPALCTCGP